MTARGRPKGRTLAAALKACGGVGGPLEQCAAEILRDMFDRHDGDPDLVAGELGVSDRTVRRIVAALPVARRRSNREEIP